MALVLGLAAVALILIGIDRYVHAETEVFGRWSQLIDNLSASPQECYTELGKALEARAIPRLKVAYVEIPEGGIILSATRLYMRVQRGTQFMDVCAAPFGRGFFFSWWLVRRPSLLLLLPVIGWIAVRLSPVTYYKLDTALMFQTAVHDALMEVIDGVTSAKGVRRLSEEERKPIMPGFVGR